MFSGGNYEFATHRLLDEQTPVQRHVAMTWAQRLKRLFNIDVETCRACGGTAKVIACIEDPVVIDKILTHLNEKALPIKAPSLPESRAPLQIGWTLGHRATSRLYRLSPLPTAIPMAAHEGVERQVTGRNTSYMPENGRSGNDCDELTPLQTNSSLTARLQALHFMSPHKTGSR